MNHHEKKRIRQIARTQRLKQKNAGKPYVNKKMEAMHERMSQAVQIMVKRGILPPINFHKPEDKDFVYEEPKPLTPICKKCEYKVVSEFFDLESMGALEFQEQCEKCIIKQDRMSNEAAQGLSETSSK